MLKKFGDYLYDLCPCWLYNWYISVKPKNIYTKLKYFYQRMRWGFDDTETWSLDYAFYKWILPRLKRFKEVSCAYPNNKSEQEWDNELSINIKRLEKIVDDTYSSESFDDISDFNKWFYTNINNLWW